MTNTWKIVDRHRQLVGTATVTNQGDGYSGEIDLSACPSDYRELFARWEQAVNDQLFGHLDELQAQIDKLELQIVARDGLISLVNVQIFPSSQRLSFQASAAAGVLAKTA